MQIIRGFVKWILALVLFQCSVLAVAHDARPVVVTLTEQLPAAYQFSIRVPETVEPGNMPGVAWPQDCTEQVLQTSSGYVEGSVICNSPLQGQTLVLDYPFFNPSLASFYRLTTREGITLTAMLTPTQPGWDIPVEATAGSVATEYLALGVEHILGGFDHLLFVLGLLVIARTLKRILWTVTGFTLAHSITLSLSSLGLVTIPIVPVEAVIALSILFLAHEISRQEKSSLTYQYPLLVSFGFGLLHGLGFASALGEIGLVQNEVVVSLLFFNLGVEVGQVTFILVVCLLLWVLRLAARWQASLAEVLSVQRAELLAAYVIGIPSAYWFIDRVAAFLF